MKIIFIGTPDFAVPCLERIISDGYEVAAVITQPDKPKGRNFTLTSPPVKVYAITHNIPVFQPLALKNSELELLPLLNVYRPDLIVVAAYGKILPEYFLNFTRLGCINIHASLLPKYRGAAPIQWAIINGEKQTGITSMYMAKEMDSGDIILKSTITIEENDTAGTLFEKLAVLGAENLSKTLKLIESGKAKRESQEHSKATLAPMITKSNTIIDWNNDIELIYNFVRGLNPIPCAHTILNGKMFKILSVQKSSEFRSGSCGELFEKGNEYYVICRNGSVILKEIVPESCKKMMASEYFRGHKIDSSHKFC